MPGRGQRTWGKERAGQESSPIGLKIVMYSGDKYEDCARTILSHCP